ncbi:bifunctional 4-hydroxy-2-oxoglutarate aldolase/2-dehydro-3-deoxy-phosphogluconate aldolase [Portibacter marinus]|uniref:bifunctional 4-hydroxy-2-oxoglutarate aldolase/2-dehydro-3-deoxy-phosphogluconate aldolase n=1 Tax=Portibacter marinus TaxID=2898660 RepID=UPI001F45EFEA|nr:bifunctional 4-hydroxy-2-oxoglutarate aldolase/2-dehydro-3-deoxy-phosphogluconate aldolase [Portibacter marinus]
MKKADVIDMICEYKSIVIIRSSLSDHVAHTCHAVYEGGLPIIEVTSNTPDYLEIIKEVKRGHSGILMGAGTILTATQAGEAIAAGAQFLVTPILSRDVLVYANSRDVPVVMGAFSPSEIYRAWYWGADFIKVFPASHLSPKYLSDVAAPLGAMNFVPTGGINETNIQEWQDSGAVAFGLGSSIVHPDLISDQKYDEISRKASVFRNLLT